MRLILYSKPGCHLCEGLKEKLEQIPNPSFELEIRDITTREDWWAAYQFEIPVLCKEIKSETGAELKEEVLPRLSPRLTVAQLQKKLEKY